MKQPVHQGDFSLPNRTLIHYAEQPCLGEVETDRRQLTPEQRHYYQHVAELLGEVSLKTMCVGAKSPVQLPVVDHDLALYPEFTGFSIIDLTQNCVRC